MECIEPSTTSENEKYQLTVGYDVCFSVTCLIYRLLIWFNGCLFFLQDTRVISRKDCKTVIGKVHLNIS